MPRRSEFLAAPVGPWGSRFEAAAPFGASCLSGWPCIHSAPGVVEDHRWLNIRQTHFEMGELALRATSWPTVLRSWLACLVLSACDQKTR